MRLNKRHPLRISRGVSTGSDNLFVFVGDGRLEGIGECAPGAGSDDGHADRCEDALRPLEDLARLSPFQAWARMREAGADPSARAGLDIAMWDLLAKRAQLPLHELLGLPAPRVPTSVTVGIETPERVAELTTEKITASGARYLKLKLGRAEGIEADQAAYLAARGVAEPLGASLRVDANGGWSLADAKVMLAWLAAYDCDYVEQPLPAGQEDALPELYASRPIPIFLDESCRMSADVPGLADRCDGVNVKLMKTGGITEALRVVATARAHGLQTMVGCMGESSVAIAAAASIGALFDHIDLDSHLNLQPDPASGLDLVEGIVTPTDEPGHGAFLVE